MYINRHRVLQPGIEKGKFTDDELGRLAFGVCIFGEGKWSSVIQLVPKRTDTQCRCRWKDLKKREDSRSKMLIRKAKTENPETMLDYLKDVVSPSTHDELRTLLSKGVDRLIESIRATTRVDSHISDIAATPLFEDGQVVDLLPVPLVSEKRSTSRLSSSRETSFVKRLEDTKDLEFDPRCVKRRRRVIEEKSALVNVEQPMPMPMPSLPEPPPHPGTGFLREGIDQMHVHAKEEDSVGPFLSLDIPSVLCEWEKIACTSQARVDRGNGANDVK
eukprot:TRINITY_DN16584_c0_g1_i1.p1 TRINITY_DN16584_c0_g1~~TRINITY_DN16584_c0_g1_i1.p1  ORF type:complete len:274 (+),score=66.64 TRINITY_DN16584_c0_g1_i1:343-1164(+)